MPRRRRTQKSPFDALIGIIPAFVGLILLGSFYSPTFKQRVQELATLAMVLGLVFLAAVIVWAVWRHSRRKAETASASLSPPDSTPATSDKTSPSQSGSPARFTPELLSQLEWKRFEDVVAAYMRQTGREARTTRIGAEGGVDVEILDPATGKVTCLVQCKAWDAYRVGIKPVRELFGVMAAGGVPAGAFYTTGTFTDEALDFGRAHSLDLVDGTEFIRRLTQLPADAAARLLTTATEGDYTTPTCPSCGVKMLLRTATKGRSEGDSFWGCRHYPRCRSTLRVPRAA